MTNKQMALCNGIIHSASLTAGAAGGGMAQVVRSDRLGDYSDPSRLWHSLLGRCLELHWIILQHRLLVPVELR